MPRTRIPGTKAGQRDGSKNLQDCTEKGAGGGTRATGPQDRAPQSSPADGAVSRIPGYRTPKTGPQTLETRANWSMFNQ